MPAATAADRFPADPAEPADRADRADRAHRADRADRADPAELTDAQILGRKLALARRKAELSIEDIAAATRIRPAMVREIEAGDFVHCGGDVYARGHVRAIARCVGIDPEPLIAAYPPVVPTELPPRPRPRIVARSAGSENTTGTEGTAGSGGSDSKAAGPASAAADRPAAHRPASAAVPTSAARDNAARFAARVPSRVIRPAAGGASGVGGLSGAGGSVGTGGGRSGGGPSGATLGAVAGGASRGSGSGPVRPPQPGRKDDAGRIERQPKAANWTAAMLVALLGLVVFAGVQLLGGDGGKQPAAAVPAPVPKPAAIPAAPAPVPPPAPKDVEVRIAAIGADSWLNVTGNDGRVLFDNLLPAGATQSFKDAKQLGVTLGNASAVHMNLNGKDLGAAGGPGQVVHWTLNPTGAVNN